MKKGDRDNIDDLFRSKLYDFEVETAPEDWDAIEKRLTRGWQRLLWRPCWFYLLVFLGTARKKNW